MGKKICFNCAFCSERYPAFIDVCDKTERIITDVFTESCNEFAPTEEVNEV